MNARPQNTLAAPLPARPASDGRTSSPQKTTPPRDALQALLAFASLHQQIRDRNSGGSADRRSLSASIAEAERFALDDVLQLVAERAMAITRADGVAIALAEGDAIVCRASVGKIAPDIGARLNPSSGFSGACLTSGSVVRCDDANHDPRVNPYICRQLGSRSMVAVPLSAKQTVIGLIETFATNTHHFTDADVRKLNLLAELILAAMQPEEEDRLAEISRAVVTRPVPDAIRREPAVRPREPQLVIAPPRPPVPQIAAPEIIHVETVREVKELKTETEMATLVESPEPTPVPSKRALWLRLALVVAAALSAAVWWHGRAKNTVSPNVSQSGPAITATQQSSTLPPSDTAAESAHHAAGVTEITGIRHWSSADSSTVAIDLQDQVQYEAHRLSEPERIYFDLHDTKLDPKLAHSIEVGDPMLLRVRAAQSTEGVTRIVLETRSAANFSVSLEQNPYRLLVEIRSLNSKPQPRAKVDLFGPSNSPIAPQPAITVATNQAPTIKATAAPKFRIVLDAGHGGWDLGTVGRKGLLEKDLTLDLVSRLGKLVESRLGAEVVYTRADDTYVPLEKRTELANVARANLFLSVHANYSDYASARGVETYYTNTYSSVHARTPDAQDGNLQNANWTSVNIREKVDESRRFAATVQQSLYHALAVKSDVPNRGVKEASYVVLTGTTMPAVLTEVSFVSSPTDETNLQSSAYRQQIAEALYQGIARYVETTHHVNSASIKRPSGN